MTISIESKLGIIEMIEVKTLMAEKRTYIENIMKKALERAKINFIEQYPVKERTGDFAPKYMLDFLVTSGNFRIDVECDGEEFHSGYNKHKKDIYRDAWLYKKWYC